MLRHCSSPATNDFIAGINTNIPNRGLREPYETVSCDACVRWEVIGNSDLANSLASPQPPSARSSPNL